MQTPMAAELGLATSGRFASFLNLWQNVDGTRQSPLGHLNPVSAGCSLQPLTGSGTEVASTGNAHPWP